MLVDNGSAMDALVLDANDPERLDTAAAALDCRVVLGGIGGGGIRPIFLQKSGGGSFVISMTSWNGPAGCKISASSSLLSSSTNEACL